MWRQVEQAGPLRGRPGAPRGSRRTGSASASRRSRPSGRRAPRGASSERRGARVGVRSSVGRVPAQACRARARAVRRRPRRPGRRAPARSRTSGAPAASANGDPADLVELVVVALEVPADRLHEQVVDGLVDPGAALDERVLDDVEGRDDADLEAGLLGAPRAGPSPRASRAGWAFPWAASRCTPSRSRRRRPATSWGTPSTNRMTMPPAEVAVALLQARHGAAAARGRRPAARGAELRPANGGTRAGEPGRPVGAVGPA